MLEDYIHTEAKRLSRDCSCAFLAMDAKYLKRFGVGGIVISKNRVNNTLKELDKYLSCGTQVFTIPTSSKITNKLHFNIV